MIKTTFVFSLGAVAGAAASYIYWKSHFEKWAQEEINTMKAYYSDNTIDDKHVNRPEDDKKQGNNIDDTTSIQDQKDGMVPEMMEYARTISNFGYTNYSDQVQGDEDMFEKPYVITPDEFGDFYDYDCQSLNYHSNGILTDEMDEPIDDVENIVGKDFADHFGEHDDDVVYVRNDRLKCDYEILRNVEPF